MDNIILYLGFNVNDLLKQIWEIMGKPKLIWSPIQLRIENQDKIFHIGRQIRVNVNIDGVHNTTIFEVIEIVDDRKLYPTLLGLDLDFGNQTIIDLKNTKKIFELGYLRVTTPLYFR